MISLNMERPAYCGETVSGDFSFLAAAKENASKIMDKIGDFSMSHSNYFGWRLVFGAETSSPKKPGNLVAALAFSSILLQAPMGGLHSPVFFAPVVFAPFAFSPIQRRVHKGHAHSPVFSAPAILIHMSEPERRLIDGSRLLVYSVN